MPRERWREIEHASTTPSSPDPSASRPSAAAGAVRRATTRCRHEVESLLAHERAASAFLETPAGRRGGRRPQAPTFVGRRVRSRIPLLRAARRRRNGRGLSCARRARSGAGRRHQDPAVALREPIRDACARFEHEARLLAALNHPEHRRDLRHVEETEWHHGAGASSCVEGESAGGIRRRTRARTSPASTPAMVPRTGLARPRRADDLPRQIAEALARRRTSAASSSRDLKPANIRITPDGVVRGSSTSASRSSGREARRPGVSRRAARATRRSSAAGRTRDGRSPRHRSAYIESRASRRGSRPTNAKRPLVASASSCWRC